MTGTWIINIRKEKRHLFLEGFFFQHAQRILKKKKKNVSRFVASANRTAERSELLLSLTDSSYLPWCFAALGTLAVAAHASFGRFPFCPAPVLLPSPATRRPTNCHPRECQSVGFCACTVASPHYGTRPSLGSNLCHCGCLIRHSDRGDRRKYTLV